MMNINIPAYMFREKDDIYFKGSGPKKDGNISLSYQTGGMCELLIVTEGDELITRATVSSAELAAAANAILEIARGQGYFVTQY